jgi:hypothetical protein
MTWIGSIKMNENTIEEVRKICQEIELKDESFKWKVDDNKLLITHENNKNLVYKRVLWLINKVKPLEGCKFKVKWSKI